MLFVLTPMPMLITARSKDESDTLSQQGKLHTAAACFHTVANAIG